MTEKNLVIDGLELKYKGLFNLNALLKQVDSVTKERGYSRVEKRRKEHIRTTGKEFSIELRPTKKKEEYYDLMVKIRIGIVNMKDVEVVVDDAKKKMHQGEIDIIFDAYTITDLRERWEQTPWYFFLRNMFERVFFRVHVDRHVAELIDDVHFIHNNIKAHLQLHRF